MIDNGKVEWVVEPFILPIDYGLFVLNLPRSLVYFLFYYLDIATSNQLRFKYLCFILF